MKFYRIFILLFSISLISLSCEKDSVNDISNKIDKNQKWWVLLHRNYENPGIYLFDENSSSFERKFDLPQELESPHALTFDGTSLWVGGMGNKESLYQIDPLSGEIVSEIKNIRTEGIVISGEFIYYSNDKFIRKIDKEGDLIDEIRTSNSSHVIPDIAIDNGDLYYLRHTEKQPVIKLEILNHSETIIPNIENTGTYCLTISNDNIITINNSNQIVQFDKVTGSLLSKTDIPMKGWITAISPYQ